MSPRQLALVAGVALLIVVAILALPMLLGREPVAIGPSPTATASGVAPTSPASVDAEPTASGEDGTDDELLAELAEIEEQVRAIRGLEDPDIGPPDIISRDELQDELRRIFDEQYPAEDRQRDNRTLRALGLLEADQDVADLQLELLGDQVLGFYDSLEQRMVVVSDGGLDPLARVTYAHEYTHALQDAAFGIDDLEADAPGEDDRALARTALMEGDATITMLAWAVMHMSQQDLLSVLSAGAGAPNPADAGLPSWMVEQLIFPYTAGQVWVASLAGDPVAPDFAPVDAAWQDPPTTTEQVLHLDSWEPREPAVAVEVPDLAAALGDGWEATDTTTIGEATAAMMLEFFGAPADVAAVAADGWGGDRVAVATGPDEAFAVAWRLSWDSATDATEFADAYAEIVPGLPFPARVQPVGPSEVLVAHASTDAILAEVVAAAD